MKLCKYCNVEKKLDFFPLRKSSKDGRRNKCKQCASLDRKNKGYRYKTSLTKDQIKAYNKEYNEKNKERILENKKKYYQENKEEILNDRKINRNVEYQRNYSKSYREENIEYFKLYRKEYEVYKKQTDPLYKLVSHIRASIKIILKKRKFTKKCKTQDILGCSFEEFKIYLESKFEDWMTWENRGLYNGEFNYGWDIDHIMPLSSAQTEEDVIKLNHYTNLQPLCSKVNRYIKKDKIEYDAEI